MNSFLPFVDDDEKGLVKFCIDATAGSLVTIQILWNDILSSSFVHHQHHRPSKTTEFDEAMMMMMMMMEFVVVDRCYLYLWNCWEITQQQQRQEEEAEDKSLL